MSTIQELAKKRRSLREGHGALGLLLLNMALFLLGHYILGGNAHLAETHEGEHYLRPWSGEEFRVSAWVGWYSSLHGMLVFFSLPCVVGVAGILAWMHGRLWWLERRLARTS